MKAKFAPEAVEKIRKAIQEQEGRTTGQIAICEVPESDPYLFTYLLAGVALMGLVSFTLFGLFEFGKTQFAIWEFLLAQVLAFAIGAVACRILPFVKRAVIPKGRAAEETMQKALEVFYMNGLDRTTDHNAVLIFISLLEHRVIVLADKGIDRKVEPGTWSGIRDTIVAGFRRGRGPDAVVEAIQAVGGHLTKHYPGKADAASDKPDVLKG
jgi:putative membrane protein